VVIQANRLMKEKKLLLFRKCVGIFIIRMLYTWTTFFIRRSVVKQKALKTYSPKRDTNKNVKRFYRRLLKGDFQFFFALRGDSLQRFWG